MAVSSFLETCLIIVIAFRWSQSNYKMDVITMAWDNNVIIFTIVPHTTHKIQLLATAVFGPFKSNPGMIMTKQTFNAIFSE